MIASTLAKVYKKNFLFTILLAGICLPYFSFSQTNGDYQSVNTGTVNWSSTASWQKRVGGAWVAAPEYPGQIALTTNAIVTVLSGVTLTIDVTPANSLEYFAVNGTLNGSSAATSLTVNKNLTLGNGKTFDLKKTSLTVTGTTTLANVASTILTDSDPVGTNLFTGAVTVNSNASFTGVQSSNTFQAAVTNSGTFNAATGSTTTFQSTISNSGTFSSAGASVFQGTLTNSGTFTPSGATTFKGGITNNNTFSPTGASTLSINAQTMNGSTAYTFVNLTIGQAGDALNVMNFTKNINVTNLTFVAGVVATSANTLTIASGGSVTGASATAGWVNGNLVRNFAIGTTVANTYDIGDATNYLPMTVSFPSVTTAGTLAIGTITGDYSQFPNSCFNTTKRVARYWNVTNTNTVPFSYTAPFAFANADVLGSASTGALAGGLYTGGGWLQTTVGPRTSNSTQLTVTANGVVQLAEPGTPATPLSHGSGQWNVNVYNSNDFSSNFVGYFTTASTNVNSTTLYAAASSPAAAPGYVGCGTSTTINSSRFLRTNFSAGTYEIDITSSDDNVYVLIDGVQVYTRGYSVATTTAWIGNLTPSTLVEIRYVNTGGPGQLSFTVATYGSALTPPTAGSIAGNQSLCTGETPGTTLSNVSAPVAGTCNLLAAGSGLYQWQLSTDSSAWSNIVGATSSTYTIPSTLSQSTWYRRGAIDYCGSTSYTLPVKATVFSSSQGTPTVYGNGAWYCYGYAGTTFTTYKGWYSEPNLSFDTRTRYANGAAPSMALGYLGCLVPATTMSMSMKRTNIPAGTYQLDVNYQDDGFKFLVNGVTAFSNTNFTSTTQTNVWTGTIAATDNVEIQWTQGTGGSAIQVTLTLVTPSTPLTVGTIAGSQTLCSGQIPLISLTSASAATSGCSILPTSSYQWQSSTDSSTWTPIVGATSAAYTVPSAVSQTTWYRRGVTDQCGATGNTLPVKITVDNTVYGTPSVFGANQWNFYSYTGYNNFTTYDGYYVELGNSFSTTTRYTNTQSPSYATGYLGCQVPITNFTVSAKRQGFTPATTGVYQIDLASLDEIGTLLVNGTQVYTHVCCVASPITNIWTGPLNSGSYIEWQWLQAGGTSYSGLTFTELASVPTSLTGGTIATDQTICSGNIPLTFTSVSAPSGACNLSSYKWQYSINSGITWTDLANSNTSTYTAAQSIYVTTQYRRQATDLCGNVAYSNTVTVTIQNTYPGNPATYGSNTWNIYAYDDNTWGLYKGYYTNPNNTFDTRTGQTYSDVYSFASTLPPSAAPGYQGCQQINTNWSGWAKRQGVTTPGYYQIDIPHHDDDVYLLVNGTSVFSHVGCCDAHTSIWIGYLDGTSLIDLKWANYNGPGDVSIKLTYLGASAPGSLSAGTITCSPSSYCAADYPTIPSATPASGGCFPSYQWQSSPNNSTWSNITGATSASFTATTPLGSTTYFRRGVTDVCSNPIVYTSSCNISVAGPPTAPTYGNGVWNNLVYNATDFVSSYSGYYTESSLSFNTTSQFGNTATPNTATSFVGCQLGSVYYSIRMLRTGFTAGTYQIDINYHDDNAFLIINGTTVFSHVGCCDVHTNVWTGNLSPSDQVELRYMNNAGPGSLQATFTPVTLSGAVTPGVVAGDQTICNGAVPTAFTQTTPASSMCNLTTNQWQSSTDNVTFNNISGAASTTYTSGALTQTTYFRRVDSDACGRTANSNVITVTVNPAINPGVIGSSQSFCTGGTPAALTEITPASGGNGSFTYQWQSSTDNVTFGNIGGATSLTYSPGAAASTIYYRRIVTSCAGSSSSASVTILIPPSTAISTQPVNYSDCSGATATFSVVAVGGGLTYQWQQSTNAGLSFSPISGATSSTYSIVITSSMIASLYQYKVVVSSTCTPSSVTSSAATLNQGNPTFTTQPSNATTCNNGNATFALAATGAGLSYQWQVSTNAGVSYSNITNGGVYSGATTATLLLTGVTSAYTNYRYQCNVTTAQCGTPTASSAVTLTVQPNISGNTLSVGGSATICPGSTLAITGTTYPTLTGGGGVAAGSYTYQWQSSTDNVTFSPISGATSANYTTTALAQTTYFQRIANTTACSGTTSTTSASQTATVVVFTTSPSNVSVCPSSSTSFSVAATGGSFTYQWQEYKNPTWTNITTVAGPNASGATYSNYTSATLSIASVTATMNAYQYRCIVTSAGTSCTSTAGTLTLNTIPSISVQPANGSTCSGVTATIPVTASGTSLTYQWQVKSPAAGSFSNVTNGSTYQNSTTATLSVLTPSTALDGYQFKVIVSGTCTPSVTSSAMTLSVYSAITANSVGSPQTICSGTTPVQLSGSTPSGGNSSYTYQWQLSTDGGTTYNNVVSATTINYQPPSLSTNSYYRRTVNSSNCAATNSAGILMKVDPPTTITTQPTTTVYTCPGVAATFTVAASAQNPSYQWQLSTDNGSTWNNITNSVLYGGYTTTTLTVKSATYPTYNGYQYRAVVSGDCGGGTSVVSSNVGTLSVYISPTIVITPSSATICNGSSTTMVASGANTFSWSPGGLTGASQTLSPSITTTYTITGTNTTTTCSASTTAAVTVNPLPTVYAMGGGGSYCSGNTGVAVTLAGSQIGVNYQLKVGGSNTGSPFAGTGSALNFGAQTAGTYTVLATNATTSCNMAMSGTSVVIMNSTPDVTQPSNQTICGGISTALVTFSGSVGSTTFNWTNNTTSVGLAASGSGNIAAFTATNSTSATVVATVTVTPSTVSCTGTSKSFTYTVYQIPIAVSGSAIGTCSNSSPVDITTGASATNNAGITWTSNGTGTFANATSLTTATYTPSAADITAGSRTITLTATGVGTCANATSSKTLTISTAPTAVAGTAVATCSNIGAVNITAGSTATNNAGTTWTSNGTGTFANATSLTTATYTPSAADISVGSINLTLTSTGNGPCAAATSSKTLTITPAPTAVSGTAVGTCSNTGAVSITAGSSATNNAGTIWTSNGTGTFANATFLTTATYTPSAADIAAGSRTLTLTATGNGTCVAATSNKTITITPAPTAVAGTAVSTCSNSGAVNITAGSTATNQAGTTWTSNGTGSFTNATSLTTAFYTPSGADIAVGSTTLTLTSTGNGTCAVATSTKSFIITPAPTAVAGTAMATCSNTGAVNITAGSSATNNTGIAWTSNGTGTFANATSLTTATYTPSAADISAGSISLTLTSTGNGTCSVATSTKSLTITSAPVATFSYTGSPYCQNTSNPSPTFSGGGVAGTFSSTAGLVFVSTATGQVNLPSSAINTYTVTNSIAATGGCPIQSATSSIIILANPSSVVLANGTGATTICNGSSANLKATIVGGTAPYSVVITPGAITANSYTSGNDIVANPSSSTTYGLSSVTDANGCTASSPSGTPTVTVNAVATAVAGTAISTCSNTGAVIITTGSSASNNAGIAWTSSGTGSFANANSLTTATYTPSAADISAGSVTITLTATGNSPCVNATSSKSLTITTAPVATFSYTASPYCKNASNPSPTFSGGGSAGTFSSTGGLVFVSTATGQVNLAGSTANTYTVTNSRAATGGCPIQSATSSITILSSPSTAILSGTATICTGNSTNLSVTITGGTSPYSLIYNPGSVSVTNYASGNNIPVSPVANTTYSLASVTDANGCTASSTSGAPLVAVNTPPSISTQPIGQNKCIGDNASFSVVATGSALTYQWRKGGSPISLATSASYGITGASTSDAGSFDVVISGACSPSVTSSSVSLTVGSVNTWTGTSGSDWSTAGSWSCGIVPNSGLSATIPNVSPSPQIAANNSVNVKDLTIAGSAGLSMGLGSILVVSGNWSDAGTFSAGNGTVSFSGSASQSILKSGTVTTEKFYNLTVNNPGHTVTVGSSTDVEISANGTLLVTSGTFDLNNRKVVLRSAAPRVSGSDLFDSTARLGQVGGTLANASNFAIERYISTPATGAKTYVKTRYLATPVQNMAAQQWADSVAILGGAPGTGFVQVSGWNSSLSTLKSYYEPNTAGGINNGFRAVTANATVMGVGSGFTLPVGYDANPTYSRYSSPRNYVVLRMRGVPATGNLSIPMTKSGASPYGWNLLGNPYPCEVDWSTLWAANSSVVSSTMSILDPQGGTTSGGTYYYNARTNRSIDPRYGIDSVNFSTTTRSNPSLIASAQSFFVCAKNVGSSSFSFMESAKPTGAPYVVSNFRTEQDFSVLNIGISNGILHDNTYVYFASNATTTGYEAEYDAFKISGSSLAVSTNTFGTEMAMNGVSQWTSGMEIPVTVSASAQGKYRLLMDGEGTLGSLPALYLRDSYASTYTPLSTSGITAYSFDIDGSSSSKGGLRFAIVSSVPKGVVTDFQGSTTLTTGMLLYPNPVQSNNVTLQLSGARDESYQLEVIDIRGVVVLSKNASANALMDGFKLEGLTEQLSEGVYTVKAKGATQTFQQKLVYKK